MMSSAFKKKEIKEKQLSVAIAASKVEKQDEVQGVWAVYHKSGIERYSGDPVAIGNPLPIS